MSKPENIAPKSNKKTEDQKIPNKDLPSHPSHASHRNNTTEPLKHDRYFSNGTNYCKNCYERGDNFHMESTTCKNNKKK
jgi:hypothetical protein